MEADRYDRSIRLFGKEGQGKLAECKVVVIGIGGLGSAVVQQLALLGVGHCTLIEPEELDHTNRNRFIGARESDPVPGTFKAEIARRTMLEINPTLTAVVLKSGLVSNAAFDAIKRADWIFGCFDADGPRFILNEVTSAYNKPYFDLASDVPRPGEYGGRVGLSHWGEQDGCLVCFEFLDLKDVQKYLGTQLDHQERANIYGIPVVDLELNKGPSVAPLNGIIASLACSEFMAAVTGLRIPKRQLNYIGHLGKLTESHSSSPDCEFCKAVRGRKDAADVERYLRIPHLVAMPSAS